MQVIFLWRVQSVLMRFRFWTPKRRRFSGHMTATPKFVTTRFAGTGDKMCQMAWFPWRRFPKRSTSRISAKTSLSDLPNFGKLSAPRVVKSKIRKSAPGCKQGAAPPRVSLLARPAKPWQSSSGINEWTRQVFVVVGCFTRILQCQGV